MTIDKTYFDSSNLRAGLYNELEERLYLQFNSGERIYKYDNVPRSLWEKLKEAESAGSFFNSTIRGKFSYEELTDVR